MVVVPALTPVTTPVLVTVPTAVLVLLHTPPVAASVSEVVEPPAHTEVVPVIVPAFGSGLTVMTAVAADVPQTVVDV